MQTQRAGVLLLGIGNLLWADEGFGVRAVEAFNETFETGAGVTLLDGGTQGLNLLGDITACADLLVFDAIDFGLEPGSLRVLRQDEVPAWSGTKMSLHQASFQELLSIAELQGRMPTRLTLIGVQPLRLSDFGGSLSEPVRAQLPPAVALAVAELHAWGYAVTPRVARADRLNDAALAIDVYEARRPSANEACRVGDARFLALRDAAERPAQAAQTGEVER